MSSEKSYSSLLVRPEMSTSIVLNTACLSLWSSTTSIHEIQPSCFLHITFLDKIDCLFFILRRFFQQRSPFCLHKHKKDMGSPRLCLLICWSRSGIGCSCRGIFAEIRQRSLHECPFPQEHHLVGGLEPPITSVSASIPEQGLPVRRTLPGHHLFGKIQAKF